MSQRLISRSPDLTRLRDEGYEVSITANYLVLSHVPYVTANREVAYGTLVSELEMADDVTVKPTNHVATFSGDTPHDADGHVLAKIINSSGHQVLAEGLEIDHSFSSKPGDGYTDYFHKMTTYVSLLGRWARSIDPEATAITHPLIVPDEEEGSVFTYADTASTRAGIGVLTDKLEVDRVAIVGVGGTGSYILDLIAKTPVREIHLFDGDRFVQHNAFRSPGATAAAELALVPQKVDYWAAQYSKLRRNVVPHDCFVDASNVSQLQGMDFVFLALDDGDARRLLVSKLEEFSIPFIDTGIGVYEGDGVLAGLLRLTTSTPAQRDHVHENKRIPFTNSGENDYERNIQVADLNALIAALAVLRWKKLAGFYGDLEHEHHSLYGISDNSMINEDRA
ncbi:MAG TPA: ThiF family adenylyltransferase [Solirubrobacteraceae bacterium]|jgi:hypothetical protein|nr:ThiF family adenylyltransferase [Solirubrobacteraceae bacterium]